MLAKKIVFLLVLYSGVCPLLFADSVYRNDTGANGTTGWALSYRYQRHLWETTDGTLAMVIQQCDSTNGLYLELYRSTNSGQFWGNPVLQIDDYPGYISDGVLDDDNNLHLVLSCQGDDTNGSVKYCVMTYSSLLQTWTALSKTTALTATGERQFTRASLAIDSEGVVWIAVRRRDVSSDNFYVEIYYLDSGIWHEADELATENDKSKKNPKIFAFNDGTEDKMGCVVHDQDGSNQYKRFYYREDDSDPDEAWTNGGSKTMNNYYVDDKGTHWCVIPDDDGRLHLVYQDKNASGEERMYYSVITSASWSTPYAVTPAVGHYCALAQDGTDLYLFNSWRDENHPTDPYLRTRIFYRSKPLSSGPWTSWTLLSPASDYHEGHLRMTCTETFDIDIPMIFQESLTAPYDILYILLTIS